MPPTLELRTASLPWLLAEAAAAGASVLLAEVMTSPIRLAGPMNLWPPPLSWLIAGAVVAGMIALAAAHQEQRSLAASGILVVAGTAAATVAIWNLLNAPDLASRAFDGRSVPPSPWANAAAGALAAVFLIRGIQLWKSPEGGNR